MEKYTLEAKRLGKKYGARWVVNNVSMKVSTGEIVGLLGPNGAGKTTSFYMIVGLVAATRGKVRMGDEDVTKMPIHLRARRGLGYLPQEASVFRKLSVEDNIIAILETRKELNKVQIEEKLNELLDEFSIQHIRKSLGMSLSGGERRRVEIARALAMDPKFILLDEPFAGVDPVSVIEIKEVVRHLKDRGIGVLITDHNVRETLDICERAYIVNAGNMLAAGSPEEVLADETVRKVYLGEDFKL
ncbi:LPS export ABC transporter ATP-binding protein [Francisella philomiragia]|uniref:Lipopolysaccharide export system ATP-binding protein LptB n=2 Tax=Francisella philomiragia TaxID=28110 RepID=A0A080QCJ8_9GAMM|nr:LPS export ABC transporter ATP-binding protein [Francisella philomiragia]AJI47981.1 ABC transporter family protein [Francisella philomiragia]AJI49742.1 LPS export ABC transporter ATP-binding protein [Francisella philomiragia]AJI54111.1 LPS export ABC transporter ATP-binding protein [Francisella philomiragia]AJI54931.1 LPS export ABC transporter ATP-binding protein [Francisella philomiragia]AJI57128.1 LPS export ABC transporter ATP-binding protein [Francisella philomiragia]